MDEAEREQQDERSVIGMKLSNFEKETIIIFNEAEDTATIDTYNKPLISRMEKLIDKYPDSIEASKTIYGNTYVIPKKWLKVNPPPIYSEEVKQKFSDSLARVRYQKKNG